MLLNATELKSTENGSKRSRKCPLRSLKAAFRALVGPPELSAFGATPDGDIPAVRTRKLGRFRTWTDYPITGSALGHRNGFGFAHRLHLK